MSPKTGEQITRAADGRVFTTHPDDRRISCTQPCSAKQPGEFPEHVRYAPDNIAPYCHHPDAPVYTIPGLGNQFRRKCTLQPNGPGSSLESSPTEQDAQRALRERLLAAKDGQLKQELFRQILNNPHLSPAEMIAVILGLAPAPDIPNKHPLTAAQEADLKKGIGQDFRSPQWGKFK